jgi:Fic-DOC domain mobile mystery protein B
VGLDPPIPGQTPLADVSGLRRRDIRTTAELNAAEAENIRRAVVKYLVARPSARLAPFDLPWLCRLHREMFGRVWAWAGGIRRHETNIGTPPLRIEQELHSLLGDVAAWRNAGVQLDEQAARIHHRAVLVHPFPNGNGRWSRMLANVWLRRHGVQAVEWPEATIGTASIARGRYLRALRAADSGDIAELLALHREFSAR